MRIISSSSKTLSGLCVPLFLIGLFFGSTPDYITPEMPATASNVDWSKVQFCDFVMECC